MKLSSAALHAALLVGNAASTLVRARLASAKECNARHPPLTFVYLETESQDAAVEDNIRRDLAAIGLRVEARALSKADINDARQAGDFHFSLTETWGTPYDPHSTAGGWIDGKGGEGVFPSMANFSEGKSREYLFDLIRDVLKEEDPAEQRRKWENVHSYYHQEAVLLPFWGKRVPTLMNSRLTGYEAGMQQFDYPVNRLKPLTGSTTLKIAPGARTGLFKTVGGLDAHTYGPNEFFSNNWVYEGLVAYGQGGQILPSLATKWNVTPNSIGGDDYTFQLREGVTFHDGTPWNCAAAKLNFDHVLAGALRDQHGWYGIPLVTEDWSCTDDMTFVLRTNEKHGPYLQELSLIRPIRMISPAAFPNGFDSDPLTSNSCHLDWGVIEGTETLETVNCVGPTAIYGTGPFKFVSKDTEDLGDGDSRDNTVTFEAFENYWGGASAIKELQIVRYDTSDEVKADLLNGNLDVVWGAGVLPDSDISEIMNDPELQESINVFHGDAIQNKMLLLNSGAPPFDDINVRKSVIHAISKSNIVEEELSGLASVVDNIFPLTAPFCDVNLTPKWDYDLAHAAMLSCLGPGGTSILSSEASSDDGSNKSLALGLGLGLGIPLAIAAVMAVVYFKKSSALEAKLDAKGAEIA
ncbi:hypothetical protein ACHAXT_000362 [Thalassiosira profunda]